MKNSLPHLQRVKRKKNETNEVESLWCSFGQKVTGPSLADGKFCVFDESYSYIVLQKGGKYITRDEEIAQYTDNLDEPNSNLQNNEHTSSSFDIPIIYPTVHEILRDLQEGKLENDILKYDRHREKTDHLNESNAPSRKKEENEPKKKQTSLMETLDDTPAQDNESLYYRDYPIYREGWSRIIQPPTKATRHVHKIVCTPSGKIERVTVTKGTSKRIPGTYWNSRKSHWGGLWPT